MTLYESLSQEIYDQNLNLIERDLIGLQGAIIGDTIYADNELSMYSKNEVLRHELEHHYTNTANLMFAPKSLQTKVELLAERRSIFKLVPLDKLIELCLNGVSDENELSFLFEVKVEFLYKALNFYQGVFGNRFKYKGMIINFLPFSITE